MKTLSGLTLFKGKLSRSILFLFFVGLVSFAGNAYAACGGSSPTRTAADCSKTAVQDCLSVAAPGDTIHVPAGNSCSWSGGLTISGVQLIGAGKSTSGTVVTGGAVTMSKHATQYTRLSGFRFNGNDQHFEIGGSPSSKPFIVDNNYFATNGSYMGHITVNGGLFHHNDFEATSPTGADVFNIQTSENWSQAPTFGTADTNGERNIYFEDNTWKNILETAIDSDVGARLVARHNVLTDSSFVFHGGAPNDSSPGGGHRHLEIYNNEFHRVLNSVPLNKWIWVRGGSGVIANNYFDKANSPDGSTYPGKVQIRLSLACPNAWPVQYQLGQTNQSPESPPTHPLAIYGNTGPGSVDQSSFIAVNGSGTAGGTCANPGNYIVQGRDYVMSQTWSYTSYQYPHPLQFLGGGRGPGPGSPKNLHVLP